jgi:hypothetical protein
MTTLTNTNTIEITASCDMCKGVEHTWVAVVGCSDCEASAHGSSHEPFTKGHRPHCTGNCCF